jgi:hypothetical protein
MRHEAQQDVDRFAHASHIRCEGSFDTAHHGPVKQSHAQRTNIDNGCGG